MAYLLQQCSPKAENRIEWSDCNQCNGTGWENPAIGVGKCSACNGSGRSTAVNVGIEATPDRKGAYPFVSMLPGQCFIVPFNEGNEKTIRNRVSVRNKKDLRKWVVIKHSEFECYEVERVK